ncbi:MAG TPA: hypothetical protein VK742_19660 [Candidatus Sulfotelmatobacter sp.]|jgi:hypothetical protein|nr:hypothetical protein [Candidatus Sulfotelmatobacter sp.]
MVDDSKPGDRSRFLAWAAALVIAIPILCVLSTGPVLWMALKTHTFSSFWIRKIAFSYEPLDWLYMQCGWFKSFSDTYMKLFGFH